MADKYRSRFYESRHQGTSHSAQRILSIVLDAVPRVRSAIDFGCGVGTWLSILKEDGVTDITGMDGAWVKRELLQIPRECFQQVDFEKPIALDKRYDLAISLEVAEHLQPRFAGRFVESLTSASDFIVFSAAIPFQGGKNHVNEQWPSYWEALFKRNNYVFLDIIRKQVWNDDKISVWYRQNTFLAVRQDRVKDLVLQDPEALKQVNNQVDLVHPEFYFSKMNKMYTFKGSWKALRRAVKNSFKTDR